MNPEPKKSLTPEPPSPDARPIMDRRKFVAAMAALGATAALPARAAEPNPPAGETADAADALRPAVLRDETTRQLTTFNLERKSKTVPVPRGKRVTIGEVKGEGYIAQFWLTFPGWFWQHWNPKAAINQSILKTLILRIYWDGAQQPAVAAPVGDFFGAGLCEVASFASRYFGTSSGGFFCKWPMPFRKGFRVELENLDADIDTDVFCNILYQLTDPLPEPARLFPCAVQYRPEQGPGPGPDRRGPRARPLRRLPALHAGRGTELPQLPGSAGVRVYGRRLGDAPHRRARGWRIISSAAGISAKAPFIGPYHGVPVKDTLNASVAMYRVHETDAIHFRAAAQIRLRQSVVAGPPQAVLLLVRRVSLPGQAGRSGPAHPSGRRPALLVSHPQHRSPEHSVNRAGVRLSPHQLSAGRLTAWVGPRSGIAFRASASRGSASTRSSSSSA